MGTLILCLNILLNRKVSRETRERKGFWSRNLKITIPNKLLVVFVVIKRREVKTLVRLLVGVLVEY